MFLKVAARETEKKGKDEDPGAGKNEINNEINIKSAGLDNYKWSEEKGWWERRSGAGKRKKRL